MQPPHEFGIWLRQLRIDRDLTQEALAELAGCAGQTLRSFEGGRRRPSREMAARLADVLDLPANERVAFLRLARAPLAGAQPPAARPDETAPAPAPPSLADALIGRHAEAAAVRAALLAEGHRLVTLLGAGGAGKTRLALHLVADLAPRFAGGAAFAALDAVRDASGIVGTIAWAVGCPLAGVAEPRAALLGFLHERALLLVLDNLEHLLADATGDALCDLLTTILASAPQVALLVTSRERLNLQAEWVVELGGLSLPGDDNPNSVAHADAVLLFVTRAQRITRAFALDEANRRAVAAICRRLDGLPLAIELAAAQVVVLSPTALLARLDQVLPLLQGGARDLPQRQQTMRAAIRWSYDLLPADERRVFRRLGVLVGNWSLEAAEAVGAGDGVAPPEVFSLLRRLRDRSLVVRDAADGVEARYRLLEPVRQFALEQLATQPAELLEAQQRHAAAVVALAERLGPAFQSPQPLDRFMALVQHLEEEHPNVRAVVQGALERGEAETVAAIGEALAAFWWYRSRPSEPRAWLEAALAQPEGLAAAMRARALLALLTTLYGSDPGYSLQVGSEALASFERSGDAYRQAYTLLFLGLAHMQAGDVAEAIAQLERAHGHAVAASHPWLVGEIACNIGLAWALRGDFEQAVAALDAALAAARANEDTWNVSHCLLNRALVATLLGDVAAVAHACHTWLAFIPEVATVNGAVVAFALTGIAAGAAHYGHSERAARLFGAVDALESLLGAVLVLPPAHAYAQAVYALRQQAAGENHAGAWAAGRALSLVGAVGEAIAVDLGTASAPPR